MEFGAVVMILSPFKPMYPLEYRDMDTGNTGDYHAPGSPLVVVVSLRMTESDVNKRVI